ncbi:MAG: bifunctional phosphopantothenoylcysteine decarboxylase/phosphopantothenate--cysteine ligase CoaBC [Bacteroidales bacterium]|nr:bifunctional phosphopantothenoylcysteine decarboxylase/phosphopantothenate--cysteine ligase CoaBC [Bacteroidales bacterium]
MRLKGKKILIGVTASIAAYKIPILVRLLKKEGAEVQVIMTESSRDFVSQLTLATLSGRPAFHLPFNTQDGSWNSHVEFGLWADLMLIAPLSAATLSKMAHGQSDNLLTTTYLSAKCPVYFAPAMDLDMFAHPSTQKNIDTLITYGNHLIASQTGELASGLCGAGRMEEPEKILEIILKHFKKKADFEGKKVLLTAGPTYEAIDPVRFIGNYSSGRMGYAIAHEFAERGAEVILVSGPSNQKVNHPNIQRLGVQSAQQMFEACQNFYNSADIAILAAAVADFRPKEVPTHKIKKEDGLDTIQLVPTVDILKTLGKQKKNQLLIGFALETSNEFENAKRKLQEKNCDAIVLNSLQDAGAGFQHDTNKISIIDKSLQQTTFELKSKSDVASDICDFILQMTKKSN